MGVKKNIQMHAESQLQHRDFLYDYYVVKYLDKNNINTILLDKIIKYD